VHDHQNARLFRGGRGSHPIYQQIGKHSQQEHDNYHPETTAELGGNEIAERQEDEVTPKGDRQ
jgi:hypothetical protein